MKGAFSDKRVVHLSLKGAFSDKRVVHLSPRVCSPGGSSLRDLFSDSSLHVSARRERMAILLSSYLASRSRFSARRDRTRDLCCSSAE